MFNQRGAMSHLFCEVLPLWLCGHHFLKVFFFFSVLEGRYSPSLLAFSPYFNVTVPQDSISPFSLHSLGTQQTLLSISFPGIVLGNGVCSS